MEKSKLITDKIDQLITLSRLEQEPNVEIILLTLRGTRITGFDGELAKKVKEYTRDFLLPKIKAEKAESEASQN